MKYYHGTHIESLKIETHIKSRYGFSAFFVTPNKELAIQYAYYAYTKTDRGYLYAVRLDTTPHVVDFKNKVSHSLVFRNLVFKLQRENHESVLFKNVIDFPSEKIANYKSFDVLIVFNLEIIDSIKLIGKY